MADRTKYSPTDIVILTYYFVTGLFILISGLTGKLDGWPKYAIHHALVLAVLPIFIATFKSIRRNALSILRLCYPILLFGTMYRETHDIDQVLFSKPLDYYFIVWDKLLFKCQPSVDFAGWLNAPWFSEILHFFYFSYFFMIVILPVVHWVLKNPKMVERRVFDLVFTYSIFFSLFVILPVQGPRVQLLSAIDIPRTGFFFGPFFERLFDGLKIAGAAFPSSHCGAAALVAANSVHDMKKFWPIPALFAFGIFLATVFGRFHYAVDVIYGAGLGIICFLLSGYVHAWLRKIGFVGPFREGDRNVSGKTAGDID